jgi:sterol desaturase/sphingolipid hydroxylase (fatty acid hydroxylase superfamily)
MIISLLDQAHNWFYLGGFWILLVTLATMETLWPIHLSPVEPKGRMLTNFGMGVLNNAILWLLPISLVADAEWARQAQLGLLNWVQLPWPVAAALTVGLRSLAGYWLHRASHANRLLWRIHRVHHCDVAVDLSTGFRNHPFEALVLAACMIAATLMFGFAPVPLAIYEASALAFSIWSHANVRLPIPFERVIRWIFVTPDMHHVHHSGERHQTDSNYGDLFSFWDRAFGSYHAVERQDLGRIRFGLDDAQAPASILHQLGSPLRRGGLERPAR